MTICWLEQEAQLAGASLDNNSADAGFAFSELFLLFP
jgi:hypothetical protein